MEHCKLGRKTILESDSLRKIGYCEAKKKIKNKSEVQEEANKLMMIL